MVNAGERTGKSDCQTAEGERKEEARRRVKRARAIYSSELARQLAVQPPLSPAWLLQGQLEANHKRELRQLEEKLFSQCGRIGQGHIDAQNINKVGFDPTLPSFPSQFSVWLNGKCCLTYANVFDLKEEKRLQELRLILSAQQRCFA